ncbi:MAG: winged helix-turn-helix domain-containing protein, partial [Ruminiclostridium sp.]
GYERQNSIMQEDNADLLFGDIIISSKKKVVTIKGEDVLLTPYEYGMIYYMVKNNDRAISRNELLEQVWGFDTKIETRATDDTLRRLRKKLAQSTVAIDAVWGFGFRLKVRDKNGK